MDNNLGENTADKNLSDEMTELLTKYGIESRCGILIFKYDMILNRENVERFITIPYDSWESLRKYAAFILENSPLSPEEKEYLTAIEGGTPPSPFKIGVKDAE